MGLQRQFPSIGPGFLPSPLEQEWQEAKAKIQAELDKSEHAKGGAKTRALNLAARLRQQFVERLRRFRVLDPACGSGNFLYLALLFLKDFEHRVDLDSEAMGLQRQFPSIGPEAVMGIEINPYAAELARITVWIFAFASCHSCSRGRCTTGATIFMILSLSV